MVKNKVLNGKLKWSLSVETKVPVMLDSIITEFSATYWKTTVI